jgi:AcrR family transcriptional regulator
MDAVSAAASRRAQRKAQNRRHIRTTAQRLFAKHGFEAVTTAEIAAAAGVSVQTVFNHFTRKEELFFDGRAGWVSGPADAVRARRPDVPPLIALRDFLISAAADAVRWQAGSEGHAYVAALEASPALRAHELALVHQAECHLSDALTEALSNDEATASPSMPAAAAVNSAIWLAAVRAVVVAHRSAPGDPDDIAGSVAEVVESLLRGLDGHLNPS